MLLFGIAFLGLFAAQQPPARAQSLPLSEILKRARAQRDTIDFRAAGRLVHVNAKKESRSFGVSLTVHAFPERTKLLLEVTSPKPSRIRVLVETASNPASSAWPGKVMQARPGDPGPRTLDPARWGDTLLDTGFSYEDLLDNALLWKGQTLVNEAAPCGARRCYEIRSEPDPQDQSRYLRVSTFLDRDTFFPVRVEKLFRVSRATRIVTYTAAKQPPGVWPVSQIEVKTRGRAGASFLILTHAEKANLGDEAFDPSLLTKP